MSQDQDNNSSKDGLPRTIGIGTGGTMVGAGIVAAILSPHYRWAIIVFLVVLAVVLLVALGMWWYLVSRARRKKAREMGTGIGGTFDHEAERTNDAETKALLETMKRKFMFLIERLRADGNTDIYKIPWFLTIGPSSFGKSWVLKGAGLEPLDNVSWKKGTYLIDWWTCDEALVLDTAGGVVFGKEYDQPVWKSLLALLKKHRPECPINGLLVVIPAQLLWLKDEERPKGWPSLEEYASELHKQIFERLQPTLGVRLPVYFFVTQSDRIQGFREFADQLGDNRGAKGQMLGWSNPQRVGGPERMVKGWSSTNPGAGGNEISAITQHLKQVADDVRRQRLLLLKPYVTGGVASEDETGMEVRRRAAELFAFPDVMQNTLVPRLQEFLTTVFKTGQASQKPPYIRGVYFGSALREGEVLDRQRAGVVESLAELALPGHTDRDQPVPFFLKDVLFEKVFPESWLVTPLVDAHKYLKRRRRALIVAGIAAAAISLLVVGIGGWLYLGGVGSELEEWNTLQTGLQAAASANTNGWLPVIATTGTGGAKNIGEQENLALIAKGGGRGVMFSWLFGSRKLDQPRRQAQETFFERGVILPLAEFTRQQLTNLDMDAQSSYGAGKPEDLNRRIQRFQGGLVALLELELCPANQPWAVDNSGLKASRDRVLDGFINFLPDAPSASAGPDWGKLKAAFDATYSDRDRKRNWPPAFVTQPALRPFVIQQAFGHLGQLFVNQAASFESERKRLNDVVRQAEDMGQAEVALIKSIQERDALKEIKDNLNSLEESRKTLDESLSAEHLRSLSLAFSNFAAKVESNSRDQLRQLREQISRVNGAQAGTNLLPELARRFEVLEADMPAKNSKLTDFHLLTNSAAKSDRDLLAVVHADEASQPDAEPQRRMDQRIGVYDRIVTLPKIQLPSHWSRDLIEDLVDPKDTLESISHAAALDWGRSQTNLFSGLTTENPKTGENDHYNDILSRYLEFRYFDDAVKIGVGQLSNQLTQEDYNVDFSEAHSPKRMLQDVAASVDKLKKLEVNWKELGKKWSDLDGKDSKPIRAGSDMLNGTRKKLFDGVDQEIKREQGKLKGFPFASSTDAIELDTVTGSWQRAKLWQDALENLGGETRSLPKEQCQIWSQQISDWRARFKQLLDADGEALTYEIGTPWNPSDKEAFQQALPSPDDFPKANKGAGTYRLWRIANRSLQADSGGTVRINAARGFSVDAWEDEGLPKATIENPPRSDAWTIIDLLRQSTSKRPPYFIAFDVNGPKGKATVWFLVKPVSSNAK
jgi:MFS family permease